MQDKIRYFLTGFAMGSADIVPGVSGGTIAFIAGIYEKLIDSIKLLSGDVLKKFLTFKIKEGFSLIPFSFLIPLGIGLLTAVFTLSKGLSYALDTYPVYIWSFFFGLILSSILLVKKRISVWKTRDYITLIIAACLAFVLVGLVPVETPATLLAFFISGSIAITAMILPGISGSFMLLIMGKYQQILDAVTSLDIVTLLVFLAGAAIGIALFSRLLSWLFKHYHDIMIAILTGLMIGSIRKVWPWKLNIAYSLDSHGEAIPLIQQNILPPSFGSEFMAAVALAILGYVLITFIERYTPNE